MIRVMQKLASSGFRSFNFEKRLLPRWGQTNRIGDDNIIFFSKLSKQAMNCHQHSARSILMLMSSRDDYKRKNIFFPFIFGSKLTKERQFSWDFRILHHFSIVVTIERDLDLRCCAVATTVKWSSLLRFRCAIGGAWSRSPCDSSVFARFRNCLKSKGVLHSKLMAFRLLADDLCERQSSELSSPKEWTSHHPNSLFLSGTIENHRRSQNNKANWLWFEPFRNLHPCAIKLSNLLLPEWFEWFEWLVFHISISIMQISRQEMTTEGIFKPILVYF